MELNLLVPTDSLMKEQIWAMQQFQFSSQNKTA